jgi:tetratricopeptide (TPR) repeat protein
MSGDPALPADTQALARPVRRHWVWIVAVTAVAGVAVGLAVWWWPRSAPALEPPLPDLTDVDAEVVETIEAARERVQQQPRNGNTWGRLGMVFRAHDFGDEANRCFGEAERLDPGEPRWPYLQGLTLVMTAPDAGIPCLERAVERAGDVPLAPRLRLAEALLERGRLDDAQTHLIRARRRQPAEARVQLGLGRLAMLRGQWQTALEHLEYCLEDGHARKLAHALRAEALGRLGETEAARAAQQEAGRLPEDQAWPDPFVLEVLRLQCGLRFRLQQADDLFAAHRPDEAIDLLEQTMTRYPRSAATRLKLGEFSRKMGRLDRAEREFAETVRLDAESAEGWFLLGCMQARDRPREAADSFRRTIRLKPDHTLAHFNLAHRLKQLGDRAGAADEFRAALRCQPDYAPARQELEELERKK